MPAFNAFTTNSKDWRESEKLGRGRWYPPGGGGGRWATLRTFIGNVLRKGRFVLIILALVVILTVISSKTRKYNMVWKCILKAD